MFLLCQLEVEAENCYYCLWTFILPVRGKLLLKTKGVRKPASLLWLALLTFAKEWRKNNSSIHSYIFSFLSLGWASIFKEERWCFKPWRINSTYRQNLRKNLLKHFMTTGMLNLWENHYPQMGLWGQAGWAWRHFSAPLNEGKKKKK